MSEKRYVELANLIFDKAFACSAIPKYLDAASPRTDGLGEDAVLYNADGVQLEVCSPNEAFIIDAMCGHISYTGNKNEDEDRAHTPIDVYLPMSVMAEMLYLGGNFIIQDPRDTTIINDTLDEYLSLVFERKRMEPHYMPPPEEDLDKLHKLNKAVEPLARRLGTLGLGTGTWAEIEALFTRTGNYVVGGNNDALLSAVGEVSNRGKSKGPVDPYKF
jgi:hypothetical protein